MKVRLRKIAESDLMQIAEWRMSPEVTKYMYTDPILTIVDQLRWYKGIQKESTSRYWMIEVLEKQTIENVGILSAIAIDEQNKRCNRQWYIGNQRYIGRGIGRIVQLNFNDYCFGSMGMNRQYCEILNCNQRAIDVNLKLGFQMEGKMIEHICKNGLFLDVTNMAIIKTHWEKIKSNYVYEKIEIED